MIIPPVKSWQLIVCIHTVYDSNTVFLLINKTLENLKLLKVTKRKVEFID